MKLKKRGKNTSKTRVVGIMPTGLWIEVSGKEYFLSFNEFPWFQKASVKNIYSVKLLHKHHLCWPSLDIDIDLNSIGKLERYPLIAN